MSYCDWSSGVCSSDLHNFSALYIGRVAPPRGERGLKQCQPYQKIQLISRSPSWGAWIETRSQLGRLSPIGGRSPSWGAWIETMLLMIWRKERGSRSPSWGAWIETYVPYFSPPYLKVAPPRGERGLKHWRWQCCIHMRWSLPLVGSVD